MKKKKAIPPKKMVETGIKRKLFIGILISLSILFYLNTLTNGYAFDDTVVITGNKFTQQGFKGIPDLLSKDLFSGVYGQALELSGGRYRPLSLVLFAIEYQLFGENPFIGHLMNILLYALTAFVIFIMLEEILGRNNLTAFIATLLYVVHPIHTEVVANIKSSDEMLSMIGLALTLFWLFKGIRKRETKYTVYACIAYFLSLLSKENGITFLFVLPLTLFCFTQLTIKQLLKKIVPFFCVAVAYVLIRWYFVGIIGDRTNPDIMENPFVNTNFPDKLATIMWILGKYLGLLFFPHPLSSDYSYNEIPIVTWANAGAIFYFIIHASLLIWSLYILRKRHNVSKPVLTISWSILFYLSSIFLVSNIVFNIGAPMGERFTFVPSLAFCVAIATALISVFQKGLQQVRFSAGLIMLLILICMTSGFKTISRNQDWKDNITLFGADVKNVPNSAKIRYYYGNVLLKEAMSINGMTTEKQNILNSSKNETQAAASINPKFHHAFYNLGLIYQELGNGDSAIYYYKEVLKLQPTHILTQGGLGIAYGKLKGDFDQAISHLLLAISYNPKDGNSLENLGIAYAMKGNTSEAIKMFEKALEINPQNAQTYLNLSVAYHNSGDQEKSDAFREKAYQIDPGLRKK